MEMPMLGDAAPPRRMRMVEELRARLGIVDVPRRIMPPLVEDAALAERIRAKISAEPIAVEGESVTLSGSVAYGGSEKIPAAEWMRRRGERASWEDLARWFISEVDRALYEAKAAGRDRVVAAGDGGSIDAGFQKLLERAPA